MMNVKWCLRLLRDGFYINNKVRKCTEQSMEVRYITNNLQNTNIDVNIRKLAILGARVEMTLHTIQNQILHKK